MGDLWGWEYVHPLPRQPAWYEAMPGTIGAISDAVIGILADQRARQMSQQKMAMQQRHMDLQGQQVAAREAATAAYRQSVLGMRDRALKIAEDRLAMQEGQQEEVRGRALQAANVMPATEAEKMVPPSVRAEPEVQPSMQSLARVQSSPYARATGAMPQKISIREPQMPWLNIEGPRGPILRQLDLTGVSHAMGAGPTRSVMAQRPVSEHVGDIAAQIPGQMAAAQQRQAAAIATSRRESPRVAAAKAAFGRAQGGFNTATADLPRNMIDFILSSSGDVPGVDKAKQQAVRSYWKEMNAYGPVIGFPEQQLRSMYGSKAPGASPAGHTAESIANMPGW